MHLIFQHRVTFSEFRKRSIVSDDRVCITPLPRTPSLEANAFNQRAKREAVVVLLERFPRLVTLLQLVGRHNRSCTVSTRSVPCIQKERRHLKNAGNLAQLVCCGQSTIAHVE
jgi:hypothetical protein